MQLLGLEACMHWAAITATAGTGTLPPLLPLPPSWAQDLPPLRTQELPPLLAQKLSE